MSENQQTRIYEIPFAYENYGHFSIEAVSLDEAIRKAERKLTKMPLSEMQALSNYLPDSEEIDRDGIIRDENGNICEK